MPATLEHAKFRWEQTPCIFFGSLGGTELSYTQNVSPASNYGVILQGGPLLVTNAVKTPYKWPKINGVSLGLFHPEISGVISGPYTYVTGWLLGV